VKTTNPTIIRIRQRAGVKIDMGLMGGSRVGVDTGVTDAAGPCATARGMGVGVTSTGLGWDVT